MQVYWFEQRKADVPLDNYWLTPNEATRLSDLRFPKRRNDWRLGRWTAKRAVALYFNSVDNSLPLNSIEICAAPDGAPEVLMNGATALPSISLSHREGTAICGVAAPHVSLGCDLELIEARSDNFLADYFTAAEQELVAHAPVTHRALIVTLLWSAKESALKALRKGLRLDTRCVEVTLPQAFTEHAEDRTPALAIDPALATDWQPLKVAYCQAEMFFGWWRQSGAFVQTLVANPPPVLPFLLRP